MLTADQRTRILAQKCEANTLAEHLTAAIVMKATFGEAEMKVTGVRINRKTNEARIDGLAKTMRDEIERVIAHGGRS